MQGHIPLRHETESLWRVTALVSLFLATSQFRGATESSKMTVAPEWAVFERTFKSSVEYSNALQDATLQVLFTSPQGQTNLVYAFWDGGRTWRVRFAPDKLGRWTYRTVCSDSSNEGLQHQTGEFLCTAPVGESNLSKNGPVRIAHDGRHLEYADGKPFFWMGDAAWDAARESEWLDWEIYTVARQYQSFTAIEWTVAPGPDEKGESALTGFNDHIGINPAFFQRLDSKVQFMSQVGLVSAIVPFWEAQFDQTAGLALPDDQIALFLRYVAARFGAEPVVWVLPFDAASPEKQAQRWKKIGSAVFGADRRAPVMIYAGTNAAVVQTLGDQPWVSIIGYRGEPFPASGPQETNAADAPLLNQLTNAPGHPLIPFVFSESETSGRVIQGLTAGEVRHNAYWNLLSKLPVGLSYEARDIARWNMATEPENPDVPLWRWSLFTSASRQMSFLSQLMQTVDFWRLVPTPQILATQTGTGAKHTQDLALSTMNKDLVVIYLAESRMLELSLLDVPRSFRAVWFNPRTGETTKAGAARSAKTCRFSPPEAGDWVLVLKGAPQE